MTWQNWSNDDHFYQAATCVSHWSVFWVAPCLQALADYAVLLTHLKSDLQSRNSAVIGFGGSYGEWMLPLVILSKEKPAGKLGLHPIENHLRVLSCINIFALSYHLQYRWSAQCKRRQISACNTTKQTRRGMGAQVQCMRSSRLDIRDHVPSVCWMGSDRPGDMLAA